MYDFLVLAEGEVATPDYQGVISQLQNTFTAQALSGILVYAVGAVAGLILFWWAVRRVSRIFMRAWTKGKLRI